MGAKERYQRWYYNHLEEARETNRVRQWAYYERNAEKIRERAKKNRRPIPYDPIKGRARNAVAYAIRVGKLTKKPCEKCGETKVQAHHDDYSRPLDVRWLCSRCHGIEHRRQDSCRLQPR